MSYTYISDVQLAARYGVHRMTPWRWLRDDPTFPQPYRLSGRCTRWRAEDIEAWEREKRAKV